MEGIEDAALLFGEVVELGAGVREDGAMVGTKSKSPRRKSASSSMRCLLRALRGRGSLWRANSARRST